MNILLKNIAFAFLSFVVAVVLYLAKVILMIFNIVFPSAKNLVVSGAKRGRQLIRQSRVKKDMDQSPTSESTMSPSDNPHIRDTVKKQRSRYSSEEMDYESSPYSSSQRLLSAPPTAHHSKIERHVSEPAPRLSPTSPPLSSVSMHLLPLPHQSAKSYSFAGATTSSHERLLQPNHGPILTKQYSDSQFSYHHQQHPHLSLHRQLSLPTDNTQSSLASTPPSSAQQSSR